MKTVCEELFGVEKYEWGTCPICKAPWKFLEEQALDGDTIPLSNEIKPKIEAKTSYYASAWFYECGACKEIFYFVEVDLIKNPKVSEDWEQCFFWRNLDEKDFVTGETETNLSLNPVRGYGVWTEKTPTTEGDLYRFHVGPFVPETKPERWPECVRFYDWPEAARVAAFWINNPSFLTIFATPSK